MKKYTASFKVPGLIGPGMDITPETNEMYKRAALEAIEQQHAAFLELYAHPEHGSFEEDPDTRNTYIDVQFYVDEQHEAWLLEDAQKHAVTKSIETLKDPITAFVLLWRRGHEHHIVFDVTGQ